MKGWSLWLLRALGAVVALFAAGLIVGSLLVLIGRLPDFRGPDARELSTGDLASMLVAGATLALALLTGALAWTTYRGLGLASREAAASERALEASWRPILVHLPTGEQGARLVVTSDEGGTQSTGWTTISAQVRNVGSGPAFLEAAALESLGSKLEVRATGVVAPQERELLVFTVSHGDAAHDRITRVLRDRLPFQVEVTYRDQAFVRRWRTQCSAVATPNGIWLNHSNIAQLD